MATREGDQLGQQLTEAVISEFTSTSDVSYPTRVDMWSELDNRCYIPEPTSETEWVRQGLSSK